MPGRKGAAPSSVDVHIPACLSVQIQLGVELKEEHMMPFPWTHFPMFNRSLPPSPSPMLGLFLNLHHPLRLDFRLRDLYDSIPDFKYLLAIKHHHLASNISVIRFRTASRPCSQRQHIEQVAICATRVPSRHKISPDHLNLPSTSSLSDCSSGQVPGQHKRIPHDCTPIRQTAKSSIGST